MHKFLKPLAFASKIFTNFIWLGEALIFLNEDVHELLATSHPMGRYTPDDWGTPVYYYRTWLNIFTSAGLVLLSFIPNRRLVSSPLGFVVSLLITSSPLCVLWICSISNSLIRHLGFGDLAGGMVFMSLLFGPLPFSIILSFLRHRKGEKVTYA